MFDNEQKVIVNDTDQAIARVLVEAKGNLLNLPDGGQGELIWSGFVIRVWYNGMYKKTAVRLLGGDTVFTTLSVAEVESLLK